MKPRLQLFLLVSLLSVVLGGIWLLHSFSNPEALKVFPATIKRDCAPWDGPAFTISLRYDAVTTLAISVWQAPSLGFPVTFSLPDRTMKAGMAYIQRGLDPSEVLSGEVWLRHVEEGKSVEGRFSFTSERGRQLEGQFQAEWGSMAAYCG
jgi:hypothetical protein